MNQWANYLRNSGSGGGTEDFRGHAMLTVQYDRKRRTWNDDCISQLENNPARLVIHVRIENSVSPNKRFRIAWLVSNVNTDKVCLGVTSCGIYYLINLADTRWAPGCPDVQNDYLPIVSTQSELAATK